MCSTIVLYTNLDQTLRPSKQISIISQSSLSPIFQTVSSKGRKQVEEHGVEGRAWNNHKKSKFKTFQRYLYLTLARTFWYWTWNCNHLSSGIIWFIIFRLITSGGIQPAKHKTFSTLYYKSFNETCTKLIVVHCCRPRQLFYTAASVQSQ